MIGYKIKKIKYIYMYIVVITMFYFLNWHINILSNLGYIDDWESFKEMNGVLGYFKEVMFRGEFSILYFLGFPVCAIAITYNFVIQDINEGFTNYDSIYSGKTKVRKKYLFKSFLYPFLVFAIYITFKLMFAFILFSDTSIYGSNPNNTKGVLFFLKLYSTAITMGLWGMVAYMFSYKYDSLYRLTIKTMMSMIFVSFFMGAIVRNILWYEKGINIPFIEGNDFLDLTMMINMDLMFTTAGWIVSVCIYVISVIFIIFYQYKKSERIV